MPVGPIVVSTRLILRGEIITADAVTLEDRPYCPGEYFQSKPELVVGRRALTDISPRRAIIITDFCVTPEEEGIGIVC